MPFFPHRWERHVAELGPEPPQMSVVSPRTALSAASSVCPLCLPERFSCALRSEKQSHALPRKLPAIFVPWMFSVPLRNSSRLSCILFCRLPVGKGSHGKWEAVSLGRGRDMIFRMNTWAKQRANLQFAGGKLLKTEGSVVNPARKAVTLKYKKKHTHIWLINWNYANAVSENNRSCVFTQNSSEHHMPIILFTHPTCERDFMG